MKIIDPGHLYALDSLDGDCPQRIQFVKRFRGTENRPGTYNQDILRVLVDRVHRLEEEAPWAGNLEILRHLRMALVLHEARALCRKVEKRSIVPRVCGGVLQGRTFQIGAIVEHVDCETEAIGDA